MKSTFKIWTLIIVILFLFSCSSKSDDEPNPATINNAPNKPIISAPSNNLLCINNVVQFQWEAAIDIDGDMVSYQLQLATNNQFTEDVENSSSTSKTSYELSLNKGTIYYWRVKAIDVKGLSSEFSNTFQFYTEGDGVINHLPFAPNVVTPKLNQNIQATTAQLDWNANDVDNDKLTFDVYFGTVNPPTNKVSENQSAKTFNVTLNSSTSYYWKIVVNDGNGGIVIGQTWNFKTD
jgi:hypothetical protein